MCSTVCFFISLSFFPILFPLSLRLNASSYRQEDKLHFFRFFQCLKSLMPNINDNTVLDNVTEGVQLFVSSYFVLFASFSSLLFAICNCLLDCFLPVSFSTESLKCLISGKIKCLCGSNYVSIDIVLHIRST